MLHLHGGGSGRRGDGRAIKHPVTGLPEPLARRENQTLFPGPKVRPLTLSQRAVSTAPGQPTQLWLSRKAEGFLQVQAGHPSPSGPVLSLLPLPGSGRSLDTGMTIRHLLENVQASPAISLKTWISLSSSWPCWKSQDFQGLRISPRRKKLRWRPRPRPLSPGDKLESRAQYLKTAR